MKFGNKETTKGISLKIKTQVIGLKFTMVN
jgi:hypothetical protein